MNRNRDTEILVARIVDEALRRVSGYPVSHSCRRGAHALCSGRARPDRRTFTLCGCECGHSPRPFCQRCGSLLKRLGFCLKHGFDTTEEPPPRSDL